MKSGQVLSNQYWVHRKPICSPILLQGEELVAQNIKYCNSVEWDGKYQTKCARKPSLKNLKGSNARSASQYSQCIGGFVLISYFFYLMFCIEETPCEVRLTNVTPLYFLISPISASFKTYWHTIFPLLSKTERDQISDSAQPNVFCSYLKKSHKRRIWKKMPFCGF